MRILAFLTALLTLASTDVSVVLRIHNIEAAKGCVRVAVFTSEADFKAEQNSIFSRTIPLSEQSDIYLNIPLPASQPCAIAVFHDVNDNGELDRNLLGIPKEPYAFSNNPTSKWEAPRFGDISFIPGEAPDGTLSLKLLEWSDR